MLGGFVRRFRTFGGFFSLAVATVVVCSSFPSRAEDWPQFRGPNCTGISTSDRPLASKFSATDGVRWSATLGDGIGSPVVAAGRVFVSAMTGDETVSLFAFDAATGQKLWQRDWPTGPLAEIHKTNSHASTTPAADSERVYFYFSTLGLIAVEAATGQDAWRYELPTPFFVFKWGPGMSPVLYRDLVLMCQDDDLFPALYAVEKATGRLRWKDDRLDMAVNYSHPVVCTAEEQDDIVVAGTGMLLGYDPATGNRRWRANVLLRNTKTTPVVSDGVIYVSAQSGGIANQWIVSVDRATTGNNDNKLDKAEVQAFVGAQQVPEAFFEKTFGRGDQNRDGVLEGRELDLAFLHPDNFAGADFTVLGENAADQMIAAVRGGGRGDVTQSHVLWRHKTKYTDHIVSPLVSDGRMLLLKEGGIMTLFDTQSGQPLRGAARLKAGGSYFASPVLGDGKIYLAGENGTVVVLRNSPQYEEIATSDMQESILATPAIADGQLFIRTRTRLFCISGPTP
jgi:outer membrane protein assembly factor BamB